MKKIILIGRTGCGKTTLIQAMKGKKLEYEKTQYVFNEDVTIDTPGEYIETRNLGAALAMYTYEADVVGLLISASEPYSLFSPCSAQLANREVIGIVTKIDAPDANAERARGWLELVGCKKIFFVSSYTNEGIDDILEYLGGGERKNAENAGKGKE